MFSCFCHTLFHLFSDTVSLNTWADLQRVSCFLSYTFSHLCGEKHTGYDHKRIYIEGFSDTVSMNTWADLQRVKEHNNSWAPSFYSAVVEFESLKPEERSDYKAVLQDSSPPSWVREGENEINLQLENIRYSRRRERRRSDGEDEDDDIEEEDIEEEDDDGSSSSGRKTTLDSLYIQRNRMPPIKVCLWYNPLMYISPSATRTEWEQQLGGFPAFFIYTMSRCIYSSATNPLLKPEYFMPEAKPMTTHARYFFVVACIFRLEFFNFFTFSFYHRWHEYMDDGDNPLAGYCVAGWACKQFERVMDASRYCF